MSLSTSELGEKLNHAWMLSDFHHHVQSQLAALAATTFNEQILSAEQPIKASLISGPDRAATVLHLRLKTKMAATEFR